MDCVRVRTKFDKPEIKSKAMPSKLKMGGNSKATTTKSETTAPTSLPIPNDNGNDDIYDDAIIVEEWTITWMGILYL